MIARNWLSFRGEFTRRLTELHIDHCTTPAYMSSKNGRSERAVALIKKIINLNPPKSTKNLQELVQAVNSRPSGVHGAGSSYERFYGRTPLLHLPQLPHKLSQQQQEDMNKKWSYIGSNIGANTRIPMPLFMISMKRHWYSTQKQSSSPKGATYTHLTLLQKT